MFYVEDGNIKNSTAPWFNNVLNSPTLLVDADCDVLLEIGDTQSIMTAYTALMATADYMTKTIPGEVGQLFGDVKKDFIIIKLEPKTVKDKEQICEELNKMMECTGYCKVFLEKMKAQTI